MVENIQRICVSLVFLYIAINLISDVLVVLSRKSTPKNGIIPHGLTSILQISVSSVSSLAGNIFKKMSQQIELILSVYIEGGEEGGN